MIRVWSTSRTSCTTFTHVPAVLMLPDLPGPICWPSCGFQHELVTHAHEMVQRPCVRGRCMARSYRAAVGADGHIFPIFLYCVRWHIDSSTVKLMSLCAQLHDSQASSSSPTSLECPSASVFLRRRGCVALPFLCKSDQYR